MIRLTLSTEEYKTLLLALYLAREWESSVMDSCDHMRECEAYKMSKDNMDKIDKLRERVRGRKRGKVMLTFK